MDIRQLTMLLAVADEGSFSGAGRRLHTVQSNVSTHIARLERELGTTLVDRTAGCLSPAGQAVAARARRIQGELDAIEPDLAAMRDEITGTVRVGVIGTVGRWLLPVLFERVNTDYPLLHLHVAGATSANLEPHIVDGSLHLALVNLPIDYPELAVEPLFEETRLLAVPAGSPLASRHHLELHELAGIEMIVAPQGTAFRDDIDDALHDLGLALAPRCEIDSMGMLASVVSSGFAPGLIPASALPPGGGVIGIPVSGLAPRSVGLISHRRVPPSATTRAVVEVIRELVFAEASRRPGLTPTAAPTATAST